MNEMTQRVQDREAFSQAKKIDALIAKVLSSTQSRQQAQLKCAEISSSHGLKSVKVVWFPVKRRGLRIVQFTLHGGRTFVATHNHEPA